MRISLFSKNHDETYQIEEIIKIEAYKRGIIVDNENPDIIICIGGDGTFLHAVQSNIDRLDDVIFIGLNYGSLGFFYEFTTDDIAEMFALLDAGALKLRRINLMQCKAGNSKEKFEFYALNEVRMLNNVASLKCDVFIDDELLQHYAGNEIIVSSSLGSAGLNKSVGGAIVHPDLATFQITPIAPINNRVYSSLTSPIILYNNATISLKSDEDVNIAFDYISLDEPINYVNISRSDLFVSVFFRPNASFINKVKESFIK